MSIHKPVICLAARATVRATVIENESTPFDQSDFIIQHVVS